MTCTSEEYTSETIRRQQPRCNTRSLAVQSSAAWPHRRVNASETDPLFATGPMYTGRSKGVLRSALQCYFGRCVTTTLATVSTSTCLQQNDRPSYAARPHLGKKPYLFLVFAIHFCCARCVCVNVCACVYQDMRFLVLALVLVVMSAPKNPGNVVLVLVLVLISCAPVTCSPRGGAGRDFIFIFSSTQIGR